MATQDDKTPKTEKAPPHYRVLSGGVAGVGGVSHSTGALLAAEQIGDQERIDKLLAKGAIEVTTDAA